jgi:hypothetical protein
MHVASTRQSILLDLGSTRSGKALDADKTLAKPSEKNRTFGRKRQGRPQALKVERGLQRSWLRIIENTLGLPLLLTKLAANAWVGCTSICGRRARARDTRIQGAGDLRGAM